MSLMSLTAAELGRKIKSGEVTAVQAAQEALDAIAAKETAVNSFVTVVDRDKVLAQAENVQKQIEAGEYADSPLAGVPVAIKDNMCIEGILTTCSSKILNNFYPTYTAEAVLNLQKAGAVIIGKTNMDEFAMGSTTETSAFCLWRDQKSLEYKACAGRFVRWFLCRCCSGGVLFCPRFRYRRIYSPAIFLLWRNRY